MDQPELSRIVDLGDFEDGDVREESVDADKDERHALARRFAVTAIRRLDADLTLARRGRQVVVTGRITAELEQTCVVSLEPMDVAVDETIEVVFDPDVRPTGEFDETIDLDLGGDDPPEALVDERIDLGEVVAERFGLALDPYPRKPDAEIDPRYVTREEVERKSPFEALKGLKFDA